MKIEPYKRQLREKGFNVTIHVLHGDARASLVRVAKTTMRWIWCWWGRGRGVGRRVWLEVER